MFLRSRGLGRRPNDSTPLKEIVFLPDSDEEIFVSKKLKSRKVLQDSDSEKEDTNASPQKTTSDSIEENKENLYAGKNGKVRRIYKTLADSDESDIEESLYQETLETQVTPCLELSFQSENCVDFTVDRKSSKKPMCDKEGKAKVKSKRRLEKEERKMEKIRWLKKKEKKKEVHLKEYFAVSKAD